MKMIYSTDAASLFADHVYNCSLGQYRYSIPVDGISDIQLYADYTGNSASPGGEIFTAWFTCGANAGTSVPLTASNTLIGTDTNESTYGVFVGLSGDVPAGSCFAITMEVSGGTFFSQEYCTEGGVCASPLGQIVSCYGNLDPKISYDREGIYFGQAQGVISGDGTIVYSHQAFMRNIEVTLNGIKNEFQQGRTRNFRTESTDILLFWGELIPEWYIRHVDAVFKRGEVFISPDINAGQYTKYLVDSTAYEKVDECIKAWKPSVNLRESQYQSFSCEADPCTFVPASGGGGGGTTTCCDPTGVTAVSGDNGEGGAQVTVNFTECEPTPSSGYHIFYRISGSGGAYTDAGFFSSSPAVFSTVDTVGTQYEGYIFSDCDGTPGNIVNWSTGATSTYSIANTIVCSGGGGLFSNFLISGGTPGDTVTVHFSYGGAMQKSSGLFTRADLTTNAPDGGGDILTSSACYTDTAMYGFTVTQDRTFVMGASTAVVTSIAVVNNSSDSFNSLFVSITDVNGSPVTGVGSGGCDGNSGTGGTC